MTAVDVTRLRPEGPVTEHYDGAVTIEGPWLYIGGQDSGPPALIAPSHAVVDVLPCDDGHDCSHRKARR